MSDFVNYSGYLFVTVASSDATWGSVTAYRRKMTIIFIILLQKDNTDTKKK